jgi:hypothetical protein
VIRGVWRLIGLGFAGGWVMAALTGCAPVDAIEVIPTFKPSYDPTQAPPAKGPVCEVQFEGASDVRADTMVLGTFGQVGSFDLRIEQSEAWLRTGVKSLELNSPIRLLSPTSPPGHSLSMRIELVKLSSFTQNSTQATTAALRVTYSRGHVQIDQRIHRGDTANGMLGVQSQLNTALSRALDGVRADLLELCKANDAL